ncbi:hypothetical protein [Parabacteroides hominis]|jgi:hypothetical protein|uniref:DUF551 domain-containing protein n=1 Tax=Parabacteroides hominis TaxID=2763057 RepID=A0ABR7DLY1_9BACT|nr:hypothetical protein [Parabacteroides hominis]MBC5632090.1 hypothetical protein [Parabacteroides hominis]
MKQTVEEAAKDYNDSFKWKRDTEQIQQYCIDSFIAGAEWQAKQAPWISVEERLPKENELVLCRMVSNGAIVSGFINPIPGCQPQVSTSPDFEFEDYGDYTCDMWMSIPSFDEIIEANKDVLKRIKEKGD